MGIQGLHKGLGFATQKTSLRDFKGQTVAIDSSSWLHRSVYSVSAKYVEGIEEGRIDPHCVRVSAKYVTSRCQELLGAFQIAKVFLVMDGKRCPLKADTNGERERRRQENLKEARDYKRRGRNDKAEEKYKTCIKIKDELTIAVMDQVKQNFHQDSRVQFVWSPYEADAQLAKLCIDRVADAVITEDSDVLVYSAASHCSFPIIFKLDRQSGGCDVISMDWLLSYSEDRPTTGNKKGSVLETVMKNLASRQSRRAGFGVRLFVQGCVLAGCDYAPNKLSGVGLVNAFKYVRDCAFRNDSVRFAKVLDTIPTKSKLKIDPKAYELNLAKSEAVFYYHLVLHPDGNIRPLCDTRICEAENNDSSHHHSNHFPFLGRFGDDWSFLGDTHEQKSSEPEIPKDVPPIAEITIGGPGAPPPRSAAKPTVPVFFATSKKRAPARNPYTSTRVQGIGKRPRKEDRPPLNNLNRKGDLAPTCDDNPFAAFKRHGSEKTRHISTGTTRKDPRFVKRQFASNDDRSKPQSKSSSWFQRLPKQTHDENIRYPHDPATSEAIHLPFTAATSNPAFDYSGLYEHRSMSPQAMQPGYTEAEMENSHIEQNQQLSSSTEIPSFFDLTDSHGSGEINCDGLDSEEGFINRGPARVSLESSDIECRSLRGRHDGNEGRSSDYDFHLPDPSSTADHFGTIAAHGIEGMAVEVVQASTQSRFFSPEHKSRHRRSPHASCHKASFLDMPTSNCMDSTTPPTKRTNASCDEMIDSPDDRELYSTTTTTAMSNVARISSIGVSSASMRRTMGQRQRPPGPLAKAFKKQNDTSPRQTASQGQSWVRSFGSLQSRSSSKRCSPSSTLQSYFTSVKKQHRASGLNQLPLNTSQTDEQFLWDDA